MASLYETGSLVKGPPVTFQVPAPPERKNAMSSPQTSGNLEHIALWMGCQERFCSYRAFADPSCSRVFPGPVSDPIKEGTDIDHIYLRLRMKLTDERRLKRIVLIV